MTEIRQDVQASKFIQTRTAKLEVKFGATEDLDKLLAIRDRLNEIDAIVIDTRKRSAVFFFGRAPLWFRLLSPLLKLYWRWTS